MIVKFWHLNFFPSQSSSTIEVVADISATDVVVVVLKMVVTTNRIDLVSSMCVCMCVCQSFNQIHRSNRLLNQNQWILIRIRETLSSLFLSFFFFALNSGCVHFTLLYSIHSNTSSGYGLFCLFSCYLMWILWMTWYHILFIIFFFSLSSLLSSFY